MEIKWVVSDIHKKSYRDFLSKYEKNKFVVRRISRNINHTNLAFKKSDFWRALLGCFLTTQQRSGVGSRVQLFLDSDDPILDVNYCLKHLNLLGEVKATLAKNGLRRSKRISIEIDHAVQTMKSVGWKEIEAKILSIARYTTTKKERIVAQFLQQKFYGIGPKQSRNLIQWMGLSRYEIPIDSRMIKVLKGLKFPVPLSPQALSDENYYCFIQDAIQLVLSEIDVYPCVFDACVFASLEKDK